MRGVDEDDAEEAATDAVVVTDPTAGDILLPGRRPALEPDSVSRIAVDVAALVGPIDRASAAATTSSSWR